MGPSLQVGTAELDHTGLVQEEFWDHVDEGFQVSPTWHQGAYLHPSLALVQQDPRCCLFWPPVPCGASMGTLGKMCHVLIFLMMMAIPRLKYRADPLAGASLNRYDQTLNVSRAFALPLCTLMSSVCMCSCVCEVCECVWRGALVRLGCGAGPACASAFQVKISNHLAGLVITMLNKRTAHAAAPVTACGSGTLPGRSCTKLERNC